MTDKKNVYDEQFEELLTQAVKRCHQSEMDRLPPESELDKKVTFSPEHQRKMELIFADIRMGEERRISRRLAKVLIAAVLVAAMLFASVAAYSYFNPISELFPNGRSLMNAGVGHAAIDDKWLDYTNRVTQFAGIEELESALSNGAMYPRLAETDFAVSGVRYCEYLNYAIAEISIADDCCVLIYFGSALYQEDRFQESGRMEIDGRTCYLTELEGSVQLVMVEKDVAYVATAPETAQAAALIRSLA